MHYFFASLMMIFWGSMTLYANADKKDSKTFHIQFDSFQRDAPLVRPHPSASFEIAYINFRDDHAFLIAAATELSKRIPKGIEMIIILGDRANGLGVLVAHLSKLPWIILTSKETPEESIKTISYNSIMSGNKKMLINRSQLDKIKGKKIIILDDVISTGGTMRAAIELLKESTAKIQGLLCAFTEENDRTSLDQYAVTKLAHLPVFPVKRR